MVRRLIAAGVVLALLIGAVVLGVRAYLAATEPSPLPQQPEESVVEPEESGDDDGRSAGDGSPRRPAAPNPAPQHP